jgi:MFS transporter, SHS family, sialic acid transporter
MSAAPESETKGKGMALLAAFLGWMFDGLEIGMFPMAGRPALRELMSADILAHGGNVDEVIGRWMGWITAAFLVGAAGGGLLFGWLGDRIGRVKAMVWSVLFYSVFSGLCTFVQAPWQLFSLRFLASLGMGGEWALGVSLVSEIWPAKSRPLLSGLIGAAANVGFLIVGFIALGVSKFVGGLGSALSFLPQNWTQALLRNDGWRMIFLVGSIPALLTFFIRIFVPESEKWKSAAGSGPKPRVADIFTPEIRRYTILGALLAGVALLGTWGSVQFIPPWTRKFTGSQAMTSWTQIFAAIGAITFTIVVALLAQKFNRRKSYMGLCVMSLLICGAVFLPHLNHDPKFGFKFLLLVTLANGITAGFYGWLPLYLPELFPTRIRATGSGFCFNIGRVLAAAGALGSGELLRAFNGNYPFMCSVISVIYLAGVAVIWFSPETKGKPLPE